MVVDDDKDLTSVMKTTLEDAGYAVDAFNDPEKALSVYERGKYGLIILDIRMPGMNGFELFRELKRKDSEAKICFLTGFEVYESEFHKLFPDMMVAGFLKKPMSTSGLVAEIKKIAS